MIGIFVNNNLEINIVEKLSKRAGTYIAIIDKQYSIKLNLNRLISIKHIIVDLHDIDIIPVDFNYSFNINEYKEFLKFSNVIADSHIRNRSSYLSHEIIQQNILRLYLFWNKIINDYKIDTVVRLGAVPHFPSELSLYYLMKLKDKKFVFTWHSGLKHVVYFTKEVNSLHNVFDYIGDERLYKYGLEEIKSKLLLANNPSKLTPDYMNMSRNKLFYNLLKSRIKYLNKMFRFKNNIPRSILNSLYNRYIISGHKYMSYISKSLKSLPKGKFVYVPLHLNPEATTLPLGGIYHRLEVYITTLLNILPKDVKLVIKENPKQTEQSRSRHHIELLNNPRIHLVNRDYDTFELISKSEFTISITGTVILESSLLGKPVLMLGYNLYNLLPNVMHIDDYNYDKLNVIRGSVSIKDFDKFLKLVSNIGFISKYLSESDESYDDSSETEVIIENLIKYLSIDGNS
jgi:hypothetical protein